jgi:cysteine-rich repeat protein
MVKQTAFFLIRLLVLLATTAVACTIDSLPPRTNDDAASGVGGAAGMESGASPDVAGPAAAQPDSSSPIAPDLGFDTPVGSRTGMETGTGTGSGTGTGGAGGVDALSATGGAGGADARLVGSSAGNVGSTGSAQGGNGTGGAGQAGAGGTGPVDYSGFWAGLTDQQKLASFRVFANAVTVLTIDWILPKVSSTCSPAGDTTTTFGTPAPITSAATFTKGPVSGGAVSYTLAGQFSSDTTAAGTVNVSYSANGCNSSSIISWSAQKVVCGDGVMQWPETCDPGNPLPTAGCSVQCQLLPVAETEPNSSIATANGPYMQDALISAAISQADDVDFFAVRNPIAGSIAIEFETHGETVGTCGVDTFMQVFKSTGEVIASDDDGARAFYCSYAMVSVAAGETVYVAVSSSIAQPISRYLLHIRFPHS